MTNPYDADVQRYLELTEQIEELDAQRENIKDRLRDLGPGKHPTVGGLTVTVTPPPRSFNTDRAWAMLTPEQQALCVSPDAKKIKGQLAPALADACMDEGKGAPRVSIR